MGGFIELARISLDSPEKASKYLYLLSDQVNQNAAYIKAMINLGDATIQQATAPIIARYTAKVKISFPCAPKIAKPKSDNGAEDAPNVFQGITPIATTETDKARIVMQLAFEQFKKQPAIKILPSNAQMLEFIFAQQAATQARLNMLSDLIQGLLKALKQPDSK